MLDETGPVQIGNMSYDSSKVLKEVDPVTYDEGLKDYADALIQDEGTQDLVDEIEELQDDLKDYVDNWDDEDDPDGEELETLTERYEELEEEKDEKEDNLY